MNDKLKNALGNIDESLIEEAANARSLEHKGAKITVGILASAAAVAAVAVGANTLVPKRGVDLIDTTSNISGSAAAQPMSAVALWLSSVIPVNALPEDWTYEACDKDPVLILADMEKSNTAIVADGRYDSVHICRVKDNDKISLNLREAVETGLGLIKFGEYGMEYGGDYEILGGSAINYDGSSNAVFLVRCHGTSEDGCPVDADVYYRLYEDADGWKISPLADWFGITETTDSGAAAIVEPKEYPDSFYDISDRAADGAIETNGCLVSLNKTKLNPKDYETPGAENDIGLWYIRLLDKTSDNSFYPFIKDMYMGNVPYSGNEWLYLAESYQGNRFIMWSSYFTVTNKCLLLSYAGSCDVSELSADLVKDDDKLVLQTEKTIPNTLVPLPAGTEFRRPEDIPEIRPMGSLPKIENLGLTKLFSESADFLGQNSIEKGLSMTIDNNGSSGSMSNEEAVKLYANGANIFGLGYSELWTTSYWENIEKYNDVDHCIGTCSIIITPLELTDDILYACSPTDGTVIETAVTESNNGALYDVIIDAGNGICMSLVVKAGTDGEGGFCVSVGDEVKTGDKLLIEDGISSYSAVNFGVWNNGKLLDPQGQSLDSVKVRTGYAINAYDSTMSNYLQRIMLETVSKPDGSEQPRFSYPLDLSVYNNYDFSYGTGHDGKGNYDGITIHTDISGTPLHAGGDGTVAAVYDKNSTGCLDFIYEELGNYVIIDHGHGYCTVYGCMDEITVSVGDTVKEGDVIGTAGKFGNNSLYYKPYLDGSNICALPAPRSNAVPPPEIAAGYTATTMPDSE